MITYYLDGIYFCECEEGSMMHKVLEDIEEKERLRAIEALDKTRFGNIPYKVQKKENRDVLLKLSEC